MLNVNMRILTYWVCDVIMHGHGHYMACCRLRYGHDMP